MKTRKVPNVIRGGVAIPIGKNTYLMKGRSHKYGGIDIGSDPKKGIEVEGGEVMKIEPSQVKVFSAVPFLNGESPAEKILKGEDDKKVFAAQERFKRDNKLNDDGTKARFGGKKDKSVLKTLFNHFVPDAGPQTYNEEVDTVKFGNIKTTGNRGYNAGYINHAYKKLQQSKLNNKQIAVALASIIEESGADPFALNPNGKDYGLFQWVDRYTKTDEKDPYREIDNQMDHFLNTINNLEDQKSWTHGGEGTGYQSLKDAYADYTSDDIEKINKGFVLGFVRPKGKHESAKNRLKVAQQIYERLEGNNDKKQLGGKMGRIIETNVFGKRKMIRVDNPSFTGGKNKTPERKKYELAGNIKRQSYESILKGDEFNYVSKDLLKLKKTILNVSPSNNKQLTTTPPVSEPTDTRLATPTLNTGDLIGGGLNVLGTIGSALINAKAARDISKLKYSNAPLPLQAVKLKTIYNINPQLQAVDNTAEQTYKNIDRSTSSSQTALARKGRVRLHTLTTSNLLRGQKENIETELINKDRINRQTVRNQNIAQRNEWAERKQAFENERDSTVATLKANNITGAIQSLATVGSDIINKMQQREQFNNTLGLYAASNPNVSPELLQRYLPNSIILKPGETMKEARRRIAKDRKRAKNND